MAVDRRLLTPAEPPSQLLRFDPSDWPAWLPNPARSGELVAVAPRLQWSASRRQWVRDHCQNLEQFTRLYAADVVFPPGVVPAADRDVTATLSGHRSWRSDWQQEA